MDSQQLYNQSAMLHDAFQSKANEETDPNEKEKYLMLANDQLSILNRLKG